MGDFANPLPLILIAIGITAAPFFFEPVKGLRSGCEDINSDGFPDAVTREHYFNPGLFQREEWTINSNVSGPNGRTRQELNFFSEKPSEPYFHDFNADGFQDVGYKTAQRDLMVHYNDGTGVFDLEPGRLPEEKDVQESPSVSSGF